MAHFTGTTINVNPLDKPMHSSVDNAVDISGAVLVALDSYTGNNQQIIGLRSYYKPKHDALVAEVSKKGVIFDARKTDTRSLKEFKKDFKPEYREWVLAITNVFREDSDDYNRLLIDGAKSFYVNDSKKRLIRINKLISAIGSNEDLADIKLRIQVYATLLSSKIQSQGGNTSGVITEATNLNNCINVCSKGLWYVLGTLITVYVDDPDQILAFFPMRLIYKAANQKSYTLLVPKASRRKVCIHLFKEGETITITNKGLVDLKIALTRNQKGEPTAWYTLPSGHTVTNIAPTVIGDTALRYVMVKNENLDTRGDINFIINAAE
ncbi:MAG: hypothetical protein WCO54_12335 [Bacteroidota bacterium]